MSKYYFFCLTVIFCSLPTIQQAQVLQNLVQNPSFEVYKSMPEDLGNLDAGQHWTSPTKSSPDYFHRLSKNENVDVPRNRMGKADARTGNAYAGIYAYTSRYSKRNFREYLQIELKQPMYPNEQYCIKAHVYLAESSNRALGALGVSASRYSIEKEHEEPLSNLQFEYMLTEERSTLNKREWVEIKATYTAIGGERFIILGNFLDDKNTKVSSAIEIDSFRNPHVDFAYYFVDDICVTSLKTNFNCDCGSFDYITTATREKIRLDINMTPVAYEIGQVVLLKEVAFQKDKALMEEGSSQELDELVALLNKNSGYCLQITGHTSDKGGTPEENQALSTRRAKAVYDYLVASGIDASRLAYRGFGQSRPIVVNDDKDSRAVNDMIRIRRVK